MNCYLIDNIYDKFQSCFCTSHSTENALLKIVNDMRINSNNKKISVLILLDISSTFDTVYYGIMLETAKKLGRSVTAWFSSGLNPTWLILISLSHLMPSSPTDYSVGSRRAPSWVIFNLNMFPLGYIISKHNISYHNYADDMQLLVSLSTADFQPKFPSQLAWKKLTTGWWQTSYSWTGQKLRSWLSVLKPRDSWSVSSLNLDH